MSIKTFFLILTTTLSIGSITALTKLPLTMQSTQNVQQSEAIAGIPLSPHDKGEPDSTMSGTSRSGLYTEGSQNFS